MYRLIATHFDGSEREVATGTYQPVMRGHLDRFFGLSRVKRIRLERVTSQGVELLVDKEKGDAHA